MNNEQKISQMIIDIAGQFIEMVEPVEERQIHLDIACVAWNLSLLPKKQRNKEYKKYFNKMTKRINNPEAIKYFEMDLNGLMKAKVDLYPNVKKTIVTAQVENINSDQYRIIASFSR